MLREVSLYANINEFNKIHPGEKLLLILISLILCCYTGKYEIIIFNIIFFIILCILTKVEFKIVKKFIKISVIFSLFTAITFIFEKQYNFIILLFLRGINGAITISFFTLTTPINHLVYILSQNKYLADIADIAKSLETFLIIIEKDFEITFRAMNCRGISKKYKDKLKYFGKGISVVFRNLLYRWKEINEGLKNRCYIGRHYYSYDFKISIKNYIFILIYFIINISLIVVL